MGTGDLMTATEPRYFALLCPSFHGATMFSALLSNHSQICSAGDGNPRPKGDYRFPCTCRRKIDECDFWIGLRELSERSGGMWNGAWFPTTPRIVAASPRASLLAAKALTAVAYATGREVMSMAAPGAALRFTDMVRAYAGHCARYHRKSVFLDGEKSFSKYCSLQACGFPVDGVVHLIRDPRAFAASAKKRGTDVASASRLWVKLHRRLADMASWRGRTPVHRIRYEDLVAEPDRALASLLAFMGLGQEHLTRPPEPGSQHLIGNNIRGFDGIPRQKGDGWQGALTDGEADAVVHRCGALMQAFGYKSS
jgi:hypothetical protein